jgi:Ca2+-binding EF-hand superfamily protein
MHFENGGAHVSHWHNSAKPHDVNQDRIVSPMDVLLVINTLNAGGARTLSAAEGEATALVDVNADSQVTPLDCLSVVNELSQQSVSGVTADQAANDDSSVVEVSIDDADGDGSITLEELTSFTPDRGRHGPPHHGHGGDDALDRFDEDGDGLLMEDELPEELWERISAADTDGDGAISAEELDAYKPAPPSPADRFARLDEDENEVLTEDELPERLWDRLSSADTDGDGGITLEELTSFTPDRGRHGPPHHGHGGGAALDRFDEDGDGLLIEDELPEELWERISAADTDGDGAISAEELDAYKPAPPSLEDRFARLDEDENEVLTEDELPSQLWDRLSSADTDGDGSITPTELADATSDFAPHDHGPRSHRGGGRGTRMPFGGTARRV